MAKEKDCQNCGDAKTMNDFCKSLVTMWASSRAELKKYKERYFKVPEDW